MAGDKGDILLFGGALTGGWSNGFVWIMQPAAPKERIK
jgi:hypothetical protein